VDPLNAACGSEPAWPCDAIYRATDNVTLGKVVRFATGTPLKVLLIIVGALLLNRLLRRAIRKFTEALASRAEGGDRVRAGARTKTLGVVLRSVATLTVYGMAFLTVIGEAGISLGPLVAGAGIAGAAIGFGAQSLVRDFLSGLFLLVEDQYGVGDVVDLGLASGTVESVTLRSTRLRATDGTVWHVPNGQVVRVGNKSQQWSRALLDVSVGYDNDLRRAEQVIKAAADSLLEDDAWKHELLEEPEIWGVERLGAGGAEIRLIVKTRPASQFRIMRELRLRIKEALDEAGIHPPAVAPPAA
jgi:small-conductance mechanosensitive channel